MLDNPLRFFTHDRLDLVVKYRFFEMLLRGRAAPEVEEMYVRHILCRTGGIEPGKRAKNSIDVYLVAARALFQRMQQLGFDSSAPIPVDQWGRLRDGAHRTACAATLTQQVGVSYVKARYPIRQWGIDWFIANGFTRKYVNSLLDHMNVITGYTNGAMDLTGTKPGNRTATRS
jgi:hypothetical protein